VKASFQLVTEGNKIRNISIEGVEDFEAQNNGPKVEPAKPSGTSPRVQ